MAREVRGMTWAAVTVYGYAVTVLNGALLPDASVLAETADALRTAEKFGDDVTLAWARMGHGIMLLRMNGDDPHGMELLVQGRQQAFRHGDLLTMTMADIQIAESKAVAADVDAAIEIARATVDRLFDCGAAIFRGPATVVLVHSLLRRGTAQALDEAQAVIDRLAACNTDPGFLLYELALLRSRALVARALGDEQAYAGFMLRHRETAISAGFDGQR
jgi:adenylate cyclase